MSFNAEKIVKKQARRAKYLKRVMVKKIKQYIKDNINATVYNYKDKDYYCFAIDSLTWKLNYTYKEFKQPFYDIVVPYFIDKGFKVTIDIYENCTIIWGNGKNNIDQ